MEHYDRLEKAVERLQEARTRYLLVLPFAKSVEKGAFFDHLVEKHATEMMHHAGIILGLIGNL